MHSVFDDTYNQRCFLVTVHPLSFKIEPYTCFSFRSFHQAFFFFCFVLLETSFYVANVPKYRDLVTSSKPFYFLGAEALQSHVIREEVHLGRGCYSSLLLWMAGQTRFNK